MNGWVKVHRQIVDWEWYDHIPTRLLFFHLLLKANHKPSRYRGNDIPAGGLVAGRRTLAEEIGLSEKQIRTAICNLQSSGEIVKKGPAHGPAHFSIIILKNWDKYQTRASEGPADGPEKGQQRATSEEGEEVKKEEYISVAKATSCTGPDDPEQSALEFFTDKTPDRQPAARSSEPSQEFLAFWAKWKQAKGGGARKPAWKAWGKLSPAQRIAADASAGPYMAGWHKQHADASPLHGATYLNQERWTDFVPPGGNGHAAPVLHRSRSRDEIEATNAAAMERMRERERNQAAREVTHAR